MSLQARIEKLEVSLAGKNQPKVFLCLTEREIAMARDWQAAYPDKETIIFNVVFVKPESTGLQTGGIKQR